MALDTASLEQLPGGVLILSADGKIQFANTEAKKVLHIADHAGLNFLDFLDERDLNFNQFLKMSTGQEIWIRDGQKNPKATFLKVSQVGENLVVVLVDITNLRESDVQTMEHAKRISLGETASLLVHDLANPLAIISSKVAILKKKGAQAPIPMDEIVKFSDSLTKSADRMMEMLKRFRSYAKDDNFDPHEVLTSDVLIDRALKLLREQHPMLYKMIRAKRIAGQGHVMVKPKQMVEVLKAVVQNAGEAALKNKDAGSPWVELDLKIDGDKLNISVIDSGKGPQTPNPDDIFGLFYTTKGPGVPHGVGLAAAKKIVEKSQGSLELVKDAPNTQFLISLPLHKV